MSYQISTADDLVSFVKGYTGSKDTDEIKDCIYMGELMMRNLELPIMRSDPYSSNFIGVADSNGRIAIPSDMLKPIQFFKTNGDSDTTVVYDRVGERQIIQNKSTNYSDNALVNSSIHGTFAEVGLHYEFSPKLSAGDTVNMYYYRAFPFLFSLDSEEEPILDNGILQAFPEGYVFATLHNYYLKRKNFEDAQVYYTKFKDVFGDITDQNSKGKWSGGNTKLSSVWQPRKANRYN